MFVVPYLDVDTFLWRLLQLTLSYVDYTVLKGQAVDGDTVPPRSCLQAQHICLDSRRACVLLLQLQASAKQQAQEACHYSVALQGCYCRSKTWAKVACSNEQFWVRIRNVIATRARVLECDLENCSEEGCWVGEACQPVAGGVALVYPALQLVQALQQVACPGAQGLQARVCLQPCWGHLQPHQFFSHLLRYELQGQEILLC